MKRDVLQEFSINKTRGQKLRESFLSVKQYNLNIVQPSPLLCAVNNFKGFAEHLR